MTDNAGIDKPAENDCAEDLTGKVLVASRRIGRFRHGDCSEHKGRKRERHDQEEYALPPEPGDAEAPERRPNNEGKSIAARPHAERAAPLSLVGPDDANDRQRCGQEQCRAEACGGAGGDQGADGRRKGAAERRDGQHGRADLEGEPPAIEIGDQAAGQKQARIGEVVGVKHPLQRRNRSAQRAADRLHRKINDGGVHLGDQHAKAERAEHRKLSAGDADRPLRRHAWTNHGFHAECPCPFLFFESRTSLLTAFCQECRLMPRMAAMRRADRLFDSIQTLRTAKAPVTAEALARRLEVTVRTVYRDVAALQARRVPIEGAAGVGYVLRHGFDLPPLMFTTEEIEAIAVAMRMLGRTGDAGLQAAAETVLSKVTVALPQPLRAHRTGPPVFVSHRGAPPPPVADLAAIRAAIRDERKLRVAYGDERGARTERTIWPFAIAYFAEATLVNAWCELRD